MQYEEFEGKKNAGKGRGTYTPSGMYYLVPQIEKDLEFMGKCEKEARTLCFTRYSIRSTAPWEIYTTAIVTLDAILEVLAGKCRVNFGKPTTVQFYDMLNVSTSNRIKLSAEKIGSINAFYTTGEALDTLAEDPKGFWTSEERVKAYDYFLTENEFTKGMDLAAMEIVDKAARAVLNSQHKILIKDSYAGLPLAILYTFLERIYVNLILDTIGRENKEISRISHNFGTLIVMYGREKSGGEIAIELQPGPGSKKDVKHDPTTEHESSDEPEEE